MNPLKTLEDITAYWKTNTTPYYFVSPTPFNLLGMEHWVQNFHFISLMDTFDGRCPQLISPSHTATPVFNHLEEINAYLLGHKEIATLIKPQSKILFLFFNPELETLCNTLNLSICLPKFETVKKIDSKIFTTQLGNKAQVPSVPNVLAKVDNFKTLQTLARKHQLGDAWVVQTAYGDSGKTTFFIASEEDYKKHAKEIESETLVKIMKRIRCTSTAIEGCATRSGTFVGPLMSELIGIPDLTPYPGGWCGNDLSSPDLTLEIRQKAMALTQKLGDALYQEGYQGYFEVDYLLDLDTNMLYLGELNPRISGITAITNNSPFCQKNIPLFLFHLLEFSDIPFELDPTAYNQNSVFEGSLPSSQMILKYTKKELNVIAEAPVSGVYTLNEKGKLHLKHPSSNRVEALEANDCFLFRIMETGEYAYYGGDLAILFTNVPLIKATQLTPEASEWLQAFQALYQLRPLTQEEKDILERYQSPGLKLK